jgi:translation initiation factor IF-1
VKMILAAVNSIEDLASIEESLSNMDVEVELIMTTNQTDAHLNGKKKSTLIIFINHRLVLSDCIK